MRRQSGFTLIEILIVMVIIAGLVTFAIPRISPIDRLRSVVRKFAVFTRQTQTAARLTGNVHRMVISIPSDEKKQASFWVEVASSKTATTTLTNETDKEKKEGQETSETGYALEGKISKNPVVLPDNFYFEDIQFSDKQKVTTGKAYIYFFPQGFVTKAAIHITNKKSLHWTIVINPLTGVSSVLDQYKNFGDLQ